MHIQEVYNVIYKNHMYEYIVLNKHFKIVEYSDKVFDFLKVDYFNINQTDIFELMPELIGMEKSLHEILNAKNNSYLIPCIAKESEFYIDIHIHPGRENPSSLYNSAKYETLIILLENVTNDMMIQQRINHERNEKVLLLDEIAEKNIQLQQFNEQMQKLVQIEIKKNLEKQKMLEVQSRYAQMGEMIGMITHQWKQPLNAINMIASVIKLKYQLGKLDDTIITTSIQKIQNQTEYMNQTVNDFQHFFNPLKEKIHFNLKKTLTTVLELVRYEYEMNNITLELTGDKDVFAYGFPNEYNQVILSILSNAKDAFLAAPHDNMKIMITVSDHDEEYTIVRVKDNAGGIPDDIIDTIFDIYMTTKSTGSGLGLNIAKNIIEVNMDGKLRVYNIKDGSEFSIIV